MPEQRKVFIISGGVTKFAKAHPEMDFRLMVKKAFDYAMKDVPKLKPPMRMSPIAGSPCW